MRKIIATEYVSLDGVYEEPGQRSYPFWSDEAMAYKREELFACDAMLFGRLTYQGFAAAWPTMTDEQGFADRMNSLPKYVVSATLDKVEWTNSRLIRTDVIDEISKLKEEPGQDILLGGSGQLVRSLMKHDLIDEYRLMLHPILLGSGKRLFIEGIANTVLKLTGTNSFASGIVVLTYEPVRSA